MVGTKRPLRRPILRGALLAVPASIALFFVAVLVLDSLSQYGEKLEAVVGLVAIGVLLLVLNWFFHKVYWTEWIKGHRERRKELLAEGAGAAAGAAGTIAGLYMLGFTSVFREGFETVLFLQALQLSSGTGIVLAGVSLGLLLTAVVGVATFALERKLPYKRLLIVTGVLISLVLVVLVGNTVRTLQGVGWLGDHPDRHRVPALDGHLARASSRRSRAWSPRRGAFAFVVGSYYAAEWVRKRNVRRARPRTWTAGEHGTPTAPSVHANGNGQAGRAERARRHALARVPRETCPGGVRVRSVGPAGASRSTAGSGDVLTGLRSNTRDRHRAIAARRGARRRVLACALLARPATRRGAAKAEDAKQPNIVVVMTDDQTVESMRVMPKAQKLLAEQGRHLRQQLRQQPDLLPLAGDLPDRPVRAHARRLPQQPRRTAASATSTPPRRCPVWLQRAGYSTAHIGKYLNGYGEADGADRGPARAGPSGTATEDPGTYRMYGYTLNENGDARHLRRLRHPGPGASTRPTSTPTRRSTSSTAARREEAPFFLSVAPLAPHVEVFRRQPTATTTRRRPASRTRAPRRATSTRSRTRTCRRSGAFNEANVNDKPEAIRALPPLDGPAIGQARNKYRSRLTSLLAVDDMVGDIVTALRDNGELNAR